jgi:carboxypeptidase Taq
MDTPIATSKPAYGELFHLQVRLHRLNHLGNIVSWDRNAMMPPKGNEARRPKPSSA